MFSAPELVILAVAVTIGAAAYGSLGFGFAFIVVPVLTLVDPRTVPATVWFLTLPFAALMVRREWGHVDWTGVRWMTAGRVVGTPFGVLLLVIVPPDALTVVFGVLLCVASALVAARSHIPPRRRVRAAAGVASGVMGSAAALGGPALALAYHGQNPPIVRATLAASFLLGDLVSLVAIAAVGRVGWLHVRLAAWLMLPMLLGFWLSNVVARSISPRSMRHGVLAFAVVSGVTVLVRAGL